MCELEASNNNITLYLPAYALYRRQLESWFSIASFVRHSICRRAPLIHQMYRFRYEIRQTIR